MPPKGTKEGSHHKFFSLRGKKKENRVKKGLSEALGASLGAIGLRPEDEGELMLQPPNHLGRAPFDTLPIPINKINASPCSCMN